MGEDSRMSLREVREALRVDRFTVPYRKWLDNPIFDIGGFEVGRYEKTSGKVLVDYASVGDDGLPAVMRLHALCQKNDVPYTVTSSSQRVGRLEGGIYYRTELVKGIKKLIQKDRKRRVDS